MKLEGWIVVDEQLPQMDELVLTCGAKENERGAVMYRTGSKWFIQPPFDSEDLLAYRPTHWMPLPTIPDKEA